MRKKLIGSGIAIVLACAPVAYAQSGFGVCDYDKQNVAGAKCAGQALLTDTKAKGNVNVAGPLKAVRCEIGALHVAGVAELHATTIQGMTTIAGLLKAEKSTFAALDVAGGAELKDTMVHGPAKITGFVTAVTSHFEKGLTVISNKVIFKASTVKGAFTIQSESETPVLMLTCHSTLSGAVKFIGKPGIVKMTADSTLLGDVENGVLEHIHQKC